jgi:hypothetical protein
MAQELYKGPGRALAYLYLGVDEKRPDVGVASGNGRGELFDRRLSDSRQRPGRALADEAAGVGERGDKRATALSPIRTSAHDADSRTSASSSFMAAIRGSAAWGAPMVPRVSAIAERMM